MAHGHAGAAGRGGGIWALPLGRGDYRCVVRPRRVMKHDVRLREHSREGGQTRTMAYVGGRGDTKLKSTLSSTGPHEWSAPKM